MKVNNSSISYCLQNTYLIENLLAVSMCERPRYYTREISRLAEKPWLSISDAYDILIFNSFILLLEFLYPRRIPTQRFASSHTSMAGPLNKAKMRTRTSLAI